MKVSNFTFSLYELNHWSEIDHQIATLKKENKTASISEAKKYLVADTLIRLQQTISAS